jgi:hypothetical protein
MATQGGNGSGSTATAGPGSSSQGCDVSHNSNTGNGANHSGPYDNTCNGSPSGNGNGGGQATGKPCAGCVGNADDKNPKGQMPNGTDHNAGYECDRNHGIGRTNPAHTGCRTGTTVTPPPPGCPAGKDCGEKCPDGSTPVNGTCEHGNKCPDGSTPVNGNCGSKETTTPPPPTSTTTPPPGQQAVLGTRESGTTPESTTSTPAPQQKVLGESAGGTSPAASTPPASAVKAQPASSNKKLPFTGSDLIVVLLAAAITLTAGFGLRRLVADRG